MSLWLTPVSLKNQPFTLHYESEEAPLLPFVSFPTLYLRPDNISRPVNSQSMTTDCERIAGDVTTIIRVTTRSGATVREVKEKIADEMGTTPTRVRLSYDGTRLSGARCLSYYGVRDGDKLRFSVRN